ncbi:hypothetical protein AD930_08080 [Acetobacter malorum]|nr:hypothetical protein AD930_08080 [Acetobacter malorum]
MRQSFQNAIITIHYFMTAGADKEQIMRMPQSKFTFFLLIIFVTSLTLMIEIAITSLARSYLLKSALDAATFNTISDISYCVMLISVGMIIFILSNLRMR